MMTGLPLQGLGRHEGQADGLARVGPSTARASAGRASRGRSPRARSRPSGRTTRTRPMYLPSGSCWPASSLPSQTKRTSPGGVLGRLEAVAHDRARRVLDDPAHLARLREPCLQGASRPPGRRRRTDGRRRGSLERAFSDESTVTLAWPGAPTLPARSVGVMVDPESALRPGNRRRHGGRPTSCCLGRARDQMDMVRTTLPPLVMRTSRKASSESRWVILMESLRPSPLGVKIGAAALVGRDRGRPPG